MIEHPGVVRDAARRPESRSDRLRRAAAIVLVAVVVAAACGFAGAWQWSRHMDRSATAERVETNYDAPARPLADVLDPAGVLAPRAEWSPTQVRGRYLTSVPVTLRNRPVAGVPAVRLLHPVEITEGAWAGRVLVVDRGWVTTADGGPERRPAPSQDAMALVVRLRPAEAAWASDRAAAEEARAGRGDGGELQVRSIAPEAVVALTGVAGDPLDVYGLLVAEDGAPPAEVGALPPPETSLGNNLSYAFQWWVFGLGALGGAIVLIRRDHQDQKGHRPARTARPTPATPGPARSRRRTAEEEEDALLDAQLEGRVSRGPA